MKKTIQNHRTFGRPILALVSATSLALSACNLGDVAGLKVAGGTIDGAGESANYPGTVYVELNARDFSGGSHIIRNVGTIADVGLTDAYALFLSLADVFKVGADGQAELPVMKSVEVKLFLNNGETSITLPGMEMNRTGFMRDAQGRAYFMVTYGAKALPVGSIPQNFKEEAELVASKIFIDSPLRLATGQNLRNANTSFIMMAVPKSAHRALASLRAPKIMSAEERPSAAELKGVVVGFGENTVGGSRKSDFALTAALPSVMKRNFADIEALNKTEAEFTPLRKQIGGDSHVAKQIWEFTGSGLCESKDGSNYDTGAAVYVNGKFAGFGVLSSAISQGYKGRLKCETTSRKDMVTLVVSPSASDIAEFVKRYQK
jgi:hypothetical protein